MAIETRLHKVGDQFSVTIPAEEIKRLGLADGQAVRIEVQAAEKRSALAEDLREAFEIEFRAGQAGLRYLVER